MKKRACRYLGLLLLVQSTAAQPILISPQNQAFLGSSLSNLRVLKQSPDGTEAILTVDFTYDGIHGQTARLLPLISDRKQPKVSGWFGANPVTISSGHGTISLRLKFFNDEPGVPPELTTGLVRVLMLSDGGNSVISQGIYSRTIKWGIAGEKDRAANLTETASPAKTAFTISSKAKTRVTHVDVVNRNMDRTEMLIAVEYKYSKEDGPVRMGVDVAGTDDAGVSDYFTSPVVDVGKGSRTFAMFPVRLNMAAAQVVKGPTLPTDKLWVYLADASGKKSYIFPGTMLLVWHIPGAGSMGEPAAAESGGGNTLEIESVKQNDLFSGCVTVHYTLRGPQGRLRLRIFDSANPDTASRFASEDVPIKSGPGLELVSISVSKEAASPDVFNTDTLEIQMLNASGAVLATLRKQSPMSWARPK